MLLVTGVSLQYGSKKLFEEVKNEMISSGEIEMHTIGDAISDLNWLESGEGEFEQNYREQPLTKYQKERRKGCQINKK